jgi:hypothetical protein
VCTQLLEQHWNSGLGPQLQTPPQDAYPVEQKQVPRTQLSFSAQAVPHVPQLAVSLCRLVQVVPQSVWPAGQLVTHCPLAHVCPDAHLVPHLPQLFTSEVRSAQKYAPPPLGAHSRLASKAH